MKETKQNLEVQEARKSKKGALLRNRSYLLLLQGNLFSGFGDVLFSIAAGIWVYQETGSTMMMSLMSSISMAVSVLVTPLLGPYIDRKSKKTIMVSMDTLRGIALLAAGLWVWGQSLSVPVLILCAVLMALCNALFTPAATAAFALVVSRSEFMQAQSWNTGLFLLINLSGKGISSLLALSFGPAGLLMVNGILYLLSAVSECFITLRKTELPAPESHAFIADFKAGLQVTFGNSSLRTLLALLVLWNILIPGLSSVLLPFLQQKGLTDEFYSLYLTCGSIGAVAGTLIPGILPVSVRDKLCSLMPMALGCLAGIVIALSRSPIVLCLAYLLTNLLNSVGNIIVSSAMILGCDEALRGRFLPLQTALLTAGRLISTLAFGFFGEFVPLAILALIGEGLCFLLYLPFLRSSSLKDFLKLGVSDEAQTLE